MVGLSSPHLMLVERHPVIDPGCDAQLAARATVDPSAFAGLYRRYVDVIYRYCYHRLDNRPAAEDATSDIFLKALSAIGSFRGSSSFRSWLFTIAHNTVADQYRGRRYDEPIETAALVFDTSPGPEDRALVVDGERSIRALLARLSPQQAGIIELRLAGLTGPEIAQVLGCSLASVKIGQVRGYGRLKDILGAPARREESGRER